MRAKPKKEIPNWARGGHRKPVTRREFLAHGMIPFAARLLIPSFLPLIFREEAFGQTATCPMPAAGMVPFVSVNLAGGAAMASNFVPMGRDGAPLASYNLMGLGDGQVPLEKEFGGANFAGRLNNQLISRFLQGVRQTGGASLAKTAFVGQCVQSRDDTSENRFAVDGMLVAAGLVGNKLPNLGRESTLTGIRQKPAVTAAPFPLVVRNLSSITGALGYAGALGTSLNASQKRNLAQLLKNLNGEQSQRLVQNGSGSELKNLIDCAGIKNLGLVEDTPVVDPRLDPQVGTQLSTIWNINAQTGTGDSSLIFGSMIYNTLKGFAGAAAIELGDYDYHSDDDPTRNRGDGKDLEAGQLIGRILASAEAMKAPVFVYVMSDGAVSSPESNDRTAPWRSDRGEAGASYILYYDPAGRRTVKSHQIGWFTKGQVADPAFVTGGSPELSAAAVVANYLQICGKVSLFETVAPRSIDVKDLDQVLRFG